METGKILIYDGSFNGFLSAIYKAFDEKWSVADIKKNGKWNNELFVNTEYIKTDSHLAKQVWNTIGQKNNTAVKRIYFSFLSESSGIELKLYHYILFLMGRDVQKLGVAINEIVETLDFLALKVEKEKRRMESFAQFQLVKENSDHITLKPKYNVLPLLSKHLRQTAKGKQWQVFDDKRKYGISYSFGRLEITSSNAGVREAV